MTNKSFTISLVILLSTIMLVAMISRRGEPVVVKTNLENIPMAIGEYTATEGFFPDSVYKELNADKHIYRYYQINNGRQIGLYIGYYGTAKGGRTGHNPYACLPGSGWGIIESYNIKLNPKDYRDSIDVNYVLARRGEAYEVVFHWYQTAGNKVLSSGIQQNIQRFLGRIFHNRNDGAFIQVSIFSGEGNIEEAKLLAKSFSEKILDLLPHYWPVEE